MIWGVTRGNPILGTNLHIKFNHVDDPTISWDDVK